MGGSVSETEPPSQWRFCPELPLVHNPPFLAEASFVLYICAHPLCCGCVCITALCPQVLPHPLSPASHPIISLSHFPDESPSTGFLDFTCFNLATIYLQAVPQRSYAAVATACFRCAYPPFKFPLLWPNSLRAVKTNFTKPHLACVTTLLQMKTGSQLPP